MVLARAGGSFPAFAAAWYGAVSIPERAARCWVTAGRKNDLEKRFSGNSADPHGFII